VADRPSSEMEHAYQLAPLKFYGTDRKVLKRLKLDERGSPDQSTSSLTAGQN
jgi:hypothetical protein